MLSRLLLRQNVGRLYNPSAHYVKQRRVVVDWMCEMGEDLKFQSETIHHSIGLFDQYFSLPNIQEHLCQLKLTHGRSPEQVMQLVAVISMLISAKF